MGAVALQPPHPANRHDAGCRRRAGEDPIGGICFSFANRNGIRASLSIEYLKFSYFHNPIEIKGRRDNPDSYIKCVELRHNVFYRIGAKHAPRERHATGCVRFHNVIDGVIADNLFEQIENITHATALHAVYLNSFCCNCEVSRNTFVEVSGDAVRLRNASNENRIVHNEFRRAGYAGYSEYFCSEKLKDCTNPRPECPCFGNKFEHNRLISNYDGGRMNLSRIHPGDQFANPGCTIPEGVPHFTHDDSNTFE